MIGPILVFNLCDGGTVGIDVCSIEAVRGPKPGKTEIIRKRGSSTLVTETVAEVTTRVNEARRKMTNIQVASTSSPELKEISILLQALLKMKLDKE